MTERQSRELAQTIVLHGHAPVVASMLRESETPSCDSIARVAVVMSELESMAEYERDTACCLMLALWPAANELMMHDVCDAIDLWISHNESSALSEQIKQLIESEPNPALKRHFDKLHVLPNSPTRRSTNGS